MEKSAREYFSLSVRNCFFTMKSFMIENNLWRKMVGAPLLESLKTGQASRNTVWSSLALAKVRTKYLQALFHPQFP